MQTNARDKQLTARDTFVIQKARKRFSPTEISVLLEREGFNPIGRSQIYEILKKHGVKLNFVDYKNKSRK